MGRYRLQIIDTSTNTVAIGWQPGDSTETALLDDFANRLSQRPIGLFRTKASVLAQVREAWSDLLLELKRRV